jgi:acetyl-CoA carboxylase carboxyltransferase component
MSWEADIQDAFGKLTIRDPLDAIVDPGTFHEIGKLAGVASYDDRGAMRDFTPAAGSTSAAAGHTASYRTILWYA